MKIRLRVLAVMGCVLGSGASASEIYTDGFSEPNGAPQGFVVFYGKVAVRNQALSLSANPNGSFDCPGNPTAYVGAAGTARTFESIDSISATVTFPGTPRAPDTGDIGGLLFCAQSATDNCKVKGYAISFVRGNFYLDISGPDSHQAFAFPPVGPTYQGRWRIELSDTQISFSVNEVNQLTHADATYRSGLVGFWSYFYDNDQNMVIDDLEILYGSPACFSRITPAFSSYRPWYPPNSLSVRVPFGANELEDYDVTLSSTAPALARPIGTGPDGALPMVFPAGGSNVKLVSIEVFREPGVAQFDLLEPPGSCPTASAQVEVLKRRLHSFQDSFSTADGPAANWTIASGSWSVRNGKLFLDANCRQPEADWPAICAGSPPEAFPAARVISASVHLTNTTGSREGRTGGVFFCAREPVGTGADESGYRITWIDRAEDRGYWFFRSDIGTSTMIAGPTFSQFPLGSRWEVTFDGPRIRFRVDGNLVFDVADSTYRGGYFGFLAYCNGTSLEADDVDLSDPYPTGRVLRVRKGAEGRGDGSSWANAFPELSTALNASGEGDEIWVSGGTFTPGATRASTFRLNAGSSLYGGFDGTETGREQRNPARNATFLGGDIAGNDDGSKPPGDPLRGDADNSLHVVTLEDSASLDGVTVTGGRADGEDAEGTGAGILISGAGASISNVEVLQCVARRGSAVHVQSAAGARISNALLAENLSIDGGTLYCTAGSSVDLVNATIASNLAASGSPGIHVEAGSSQTITNCIVWNGGGDALGVDEGGSPVISYSDLEGAEPASGPGNLNRDPLFQRPARKDDSGTPEDPTDDLWVAGSYELSEASPAINTALEAKAPATDILGTSRPCGGSVDMGAFEYCEPPDFYVKLPDAEVQVGDTVTIRVELDFDHNPDTPAAAGVEGWSYGICHDPAMLNPVSVSLAGGDTAGVHGGRGPDFFGVRLPGDLPAQARNGVTVGVVIDATPPVDSTIPAINGWRDAVINYAVLPEKVSCAHSGETTSSTIAVCDTLDSPPVRAIMTVNSESLPVSAFDSATVTIRCPTLFRRGDVTRDGFIDISDPICILYGLFGAEGSGCIAKVQECLKAVDVNDDGSANITDPIALLLALFGDPPPMPALTNRCGFDRTADDLDCLSYPPCQ